MIEKGMSFQRVLSFLQFIHLLCSDMRSDDMVCFKNIDEKNGMLR